MPFVSCQVGSAAADAESKWNAGGTSFNNSSSQTARASSTTDGNRRTSGHRFTGGGAPAVPQGATIVSAYLKVKPYTSASSADGGSDKFSMGNKINALVYAHAHDNSPAIASGSNVDTGGPGSRTNTSATVGWTATLSGPAQSNSVAHVASPNIASVIQEIVNRAGWVSGNSMTILIQGGNTDVTIESGWYAVQQIDVAYDTNSSYGAILEITYNRAPNAPGAWTNPTGGTVTGTITAAHGAATDPDGDTITQYKHELWRAGAMVALLGSLDSASFSFNSTPYPNNTGYTLRSWAWDGQVYSTTYTESNQFAIGNNQTIRPMVKSVLASDSFNRANGNLSGSNTNSAEGGTAKTWITASTNSANDATNLQIVGNQLKRTLVEVTNAWFDVGSTSRQMIRAKIITMPVSGDFLQLWIRAAAPVGAAFPQDGVRANLSADGSLQVQRFDAGGGTLLHQTSVATFAAGDTIGLIIDTTTYWLLKNGQTIHSGLHGKDLTGLSRAVLRFNGTAGSALVIDDFAVEQLLDEGISSAETFGAPTITQTFPVVSPSGIASAEAFGNPTVVPGVRILSAAGAIASAQAFGTPTLYRVIAVSPGGIASAQAFGTAVVKLGWNLYPASIASLEAFGAITIIRGVVTVAPGGIASAQAFGAISIPQQQFLLPGGILSAQAFGNITLYRIVRLTPTGIASAGVNPSPVVVPGVVRLYPASIASAEAFGFSDIPEPGVPWLGDAGFDLSLRVAPTYYLVVNETSGFIVVLNGETPFEVVEGT